VNDDELEGNIRGLIFKVLSQHFPGGTQENHKNFNHDSQSLGQYLNPGPPKYKAGVLTALPWHLVRTV
jgi:hypothetical protein